MNVVETVVTTSGELVNDKGLSDFVMVSPVLGKVKLGHFRSGIFTGAHEVDNEGHVSAIPSETSHTLEMSFHE